ncbi:hypothetical protein HFO91_30400 [Rhizobium leguminosarum]|uniref:hypothetical protein n=1 Tax=Rhizobium leguminosarum TaxID=384 RepID=UPI001C964B48|nr:hypothetical protein [Rhizobium leguminosarum]MBY5453891.1 hypothetical protein [Rhizobium leguminosarum]
MAEVEATARTNGERWSLWKSANIGIVLSAFALLLEMNGHGYEIASYADSPNAGTIGNLVGRILAAPMIFVLIALVRNFFNRQQPKSSKSAGRGALTFAVLFVGIFAGLFAYGQFYFSRSEAISGESRSTFINATQRSCVQKQTSISQAVTEQQIESYCTCVGEKMADITTYKQLGAELDENAMRELRQKAEAISSTCRPQ